MPKCEPERGVHARLATVPPRSWARTTKRTRAPRAFFALTVIVFGTFSVGGVRSGENTTWMPIVARDVFPCVSVAEQFSAVQPTGKTLPEPWSQEKSAIASSGSDTLTM